MNRLTLWIAIIVAAGFLPIAPTACSLPVSETKPVYYYTIEYAPEPLDIEKRLDYVVRVNRFTATPPYNSQRIIYGDRGLHRNAYASFKWISEPGTLLAFALARDLQQTEAFRAVLAPGTGTPPTHTLQGWVEEFLEEDFTDPAQASVRVSIALIDARRPDPVQRILFQKSYQAKAPCRQKNPAALAEAMSQAVKTLSKQVAQDIYTHLATQDLSVMP